LTYDRAFICDPSVALWLDNVSIAVSKEVVKLANAVLNALLALDEDSFDRELAVPVSTIKPPTAFIEVLPEPVPVVTSIVDTENWSAVAVVEPTWKLNEVPVVFNKEIPLYVVPFAILLI
jgi:hypothetical protein